jgi:hypothetical protein
MGTHMGPALPESEKTESEKTSEKTESEKTWCSYECSCSGLLDPWEASDSRRGGTAVPYTGPDTTALVDEAVDDLVASRCPLGPDDAGAALSCLVSLIEEAESRLWDAVADARDQDYTWDEVADRLARTARSARRRYASYTRWRREATVPSTNDRRDGAEG